MNIYHYTQQQIKTLNQKLNPIYLSFCVSNHNFVYLYTLIYIIMHVNSLVYSVYLCRVKNFFPTFRGIRLLQVHANHN